MAAENPFAEMRDRAREIRRGDIRDLPVLLARLEENVRAAGGVVVRAADATAACRYITDLAAARGASLVAKSKSMATEEIKLNEAIEEAGLRVVETDLGEWILQLAGQHPSHIVAPAVHLNKDQVRAVLEAEGGHPLPSDREALVAHARVRLREVFASADIGISGVNFAVAETGTVCVVENEGNARLVTALPRDPRRRDGDGAGGARTGTRPPTSCRSSRWPRSATTPPATSTSSPAPGRPTRRTAPRSCTW